jgi:hypothetical protein
MAEKRGQYKYQDDGTVAQLVSGEAEVTTNDIFPTDKQAQLKTQIENNTTPLGISAVYTGASFDTMADGVNFTWLTGIVRADVAGTLFIEQSSDGTNWFGLDTISIVANANQKINVDILLRYVRILISNGAVAQTNLKLYAFTTFKG